MALAPLHSPLPGLTVSPTGERCCGMRGGLGKPAGMFGYQPGAHALLGMLGQDSFDTTSTDVTGNLIDPTLTDTYSSPAIDAGAMSDLPLPNQLSPSLDSIYPQTVGVNFTSNGDGSYTNIQTGQSVPYSIAEQVTAAGAGAPAVDTAATGQNLNITDPNTGATSSVNTNNLTAAAQALQAAGQLVNAAGQLTSQGRTLLSQGNLYKPATSSSGISGAVSSLTSWMGGSTSIAGIAVPNLVIVLGIPMLLILAGSIAMHDGGKRRRR